MKKIFIAIVILLATFVADASFIDRTGHIDKFGGDIWYVSKTGSDSNNGKSPLTPKLTIKATVTASVAGDAISIKAGTYDEIDLVIANAGTELWAEIGVLIANSDAGGGTCIQVTGATCRLRGIVVQQSGQIGFDIDGAGCFLEDCTATDATIAFDIDGAQTTLVRCKDQDATVTGFDIATASNLLFLCSSVADATASRGFYLSNAAANKNLLYQCVSTGNTTAGYEVIADCAYNVFTFCTSGGKDGNRVDLGKSTQWAACEFTLPRQHHQEVYPGCGGEGVVCAPVVITNLAGDETGTQDDQYYWGEPLVLIEASVYTDIWTLKGYNIFATTANKEMQGSFYRIIQQLKSLKNGGNAWDEGATVLTVVDGSKFLAADLVWIYSDYKINGEIVRVTDVTANVVTIERETVASARTGLRWNHTTNNPGTEVMFVVYRDTPGAHTNMFNHSSGSSRDFFITYFETPREMRANDGILVRMLNLSDNSSATFDMTVIISD